MQKEYTILYVNVINNKGEIKNCVLGENFLN